MKPHCSIDYLKSFDMQQKYVHKANHIQSIFETAKHTRFLWHTNTVKSSNGLINGFHLFRFNLLLFVVAFAALSGGIVFVLNVSYSLATTRADRTSQSCSVAA